jgi:hypothetical protein
MIRPESQLASNGRGHHAQLLEIDGMDPIRLKQEAVSLSQAENSVSPLLLELRVAKPTATSTALYLMTLRNHE